MPHARTTHDRPRHRDVGGEFMTRWSGQQGGTGHRPRACSGKHATAHGLWASPASVNPTMYLNSQSVVEKKRVAGRRAPGGEDGKGGRAQREGGSQGRDEI